MCLSVEISNAPPTPALSLVKHKPTSGECSEPDCEAARGEGAAAAGAVAELPAPGVEVIGAGVVALFNTETLDVAPGVVGTARSGLAVAGASTTTALEVR